RAGEPDQRRPARRRPARHPPGRRHRGAPHTGGGEPAPRPGSPVRGRSRAGRYAGAGGVAGRADGGRSRGRMVAGGGPAAVGQPASTVTGVTIRVLLADDEELVRTGLRAILEAQPDLQVTGEAADGAEVLPLVRSLRPDVVLMDVRMPAIDGIQATRTLVGTQAEPPRVLVITPFETGDYVYDALRAGASGFLLRRARPAEVVEAVRVVARGESLVFPAALRRLVAARGRRPDRRAAVARLTAREAEVLRLMAAGLSNAEIRSEEHTSELQSRENLVCRLLLEKKKE